MNNFFDDSNMLPRADAEYVDADYVEHIAPEDVEVIEPETAHTLETDEHTPDVLEADVGSGNGVAVNAAGSKITLGVGEVNSSKGNGAQITNMQGDINFGNVKIKGSKARRFDKIPEPSEANQIEDTTQYDR